MDNKAESVAGGGQTLSSGEPLGNGESERSLLRGKGAAAADMSVSSTSLSDSGIPKSPDDADLFSPPTLSRCVTDSPSHYFLRGNHHRWMSTPLLKVGGFQRSVSIPVSSTPAMLPAHLSLSPPKASSTPEALQAIGNEDKLEESPFVSDYSSSLGYAVSSLSNIDKKSNSVVQLSSQEFNNRIENCDTTNTTANLTTEGEPSTDNDSTLPYEKLNFDSYSFASPVSEPPHISSHQNEEKQASENEKLVKVLVENSVESNVDSYDSGIGSSHHETSTDDDSPSSTKHRVVKSPRPKTASAAAVKQLRRSPRSLVIQSRLDRLSRTKLTTSPYKSKGNQLKSSESYIMCPGYYDGWECIDFLQQLHKRNACHLVDQILGYLRPHDLSMVAMTSSAWHKLLCEEGGLYAEHNKRRLAHVAEIKLNRENYGSRVLPPGNTRSSSRIALKEVNRNVSPPNKRNRDGSHSAPTIISPSKIRNRLFTDKDDSDIRFLHCPHCRRTSRVKEKSGSEYEVAECSSRTCGLIFCVKCLAVDHPGKPCQVVKVTRTRSAAVVTSKKSKARLRRL
eukprot:TRINITY_DN2273_c0_g1_i1.p1 TRINITY_DN2273_c0_g1~~TRINITY_DN2273_c0_g1_i1.p1  ORF type:complete len:564 (-),score=103.59 TRINITY_DN2273_c0_g1_i1:1137-2828(-)